MRVSSLTTGIKSFIGTRSLPKVPVGVKTPELLGGEGAFSVATESVELGAKSSAGISLETTPRNENAVSANVVGPAPCGFTTVSEGRQVEHRPNGLLVDFGPAQSDLPSTDLKPAFLSALSSDTPVASEPPADFSDIQEPPPAVLANGSTYVRSAEVRDYRTRDVANEGPEFIGLRDAAIIGLKAAQEGGRVRGFLNPYLGRGEYKSAHFQILGLEGHSVIVECEEDLTTFLPKGTKVVKSGDKADELAGRAGHSNGVFRLSRQDFTKHLDSLSASRQR